MRWAVSPPLDPNGVTAEELDRVARQAFAGWEQAGVIKFEKAAPGEQADVMIGFGPAPEEAKNKHAIAWSFPPGSPHAGMIRLSSEVGWTTRPWQVWRQPVQWVLGNRVGHVLGVPQSSHPDSIMSGTYPPREEPSVWDLMELKKRFQRAEVVEGQ
jgi:Matrixin